MRLLCPAKINLHLRIGPLRADGFHPLLSWFCTTGLYDTLDFAPYEMTSGSPAGDSDRSYVSLTCDHPDLPTDRRNLVVKVGDAWGQEAQKIARSSVKGVRAELRKRIPAGAGLGGGSSDGARALAGLNVLWNTRRAADDLSAFAARFGSDLSFFFYGPSSVCSGRGEIVRPIDRPLPQWVLLILPPIEMPTREVYRTFDWMNLGRSENIDSEPNWTAWSSMNSTQLMQVLINDLEAPAFAINSLLADLRRDLESTLKRVVRMSGSGSSLFTLYDYREEAQAAAFLLANEPKFRAIRFESVELAPKLRDDLSDG